MEKHNKKDKSQCFYDLKQRKDFKELICKKTEKDLFEIERNSKC